MKIYVRNIIIKYLNFVGIELRTSFIYGYKQDHDQNKTNKQFCTGSTHSSRYRESSRAQE